MKRGFASKEIFLLTTDFSDFHGFFSYHEDNEVHEGWGEESGGEMARILWDKCAKVGAKYANACKSAQI